MRRVRVNELLPVKEQLSTDQLISRINAYSEIQTFSAQADVTVWNYFTGEGEHADEFPSATGLIRFKRPDETRMNVTFIGAKVAEMVSDGQKFKLKILRPQEKRRFIYGSNMADIERMNADEIRGTKDSQISKAGGLVNMRPQHITDSFLIKPIAETDRNNAFREEVRQVEADNRPGKKNRLVERSYYVVYVMERDEKGQLKLRRKFWFDRSQAGTPLVRQQTFENGVGRLAGDVVYSAWFTPPNSASVWPKHVIIDRRNDGYRLDLKLVAETVEVNAELPVTTFTLENNENLEEVNLDAPHKAMTPSAKKPNAQTDEPAHDHGVTRDAAGKESADAMKKQMTAKDLKARLDKGERVIIIDARHDLGGQILKGAIHVPSDKLDDWAKDADKSAVIVTYCTCPHDEAADAEMQKLLQLGFKNAYSLTGGMDAAREAGIEVVTPKLANR